MDRKKIIIIVSIVGAILLTIAAVGIPVYLFLNNRPVAPQPPGLENLNTNTSQGNLPTTPGGNTNTNGATTPQEQALQKEKQFISSYYHSIAINYTPQVPQHTLPLGDVKAEVVNYRDFSRKLSIDPQLENLSRNGFAIIGNPFAGTAATWHDAYARINDEKLPIFISTDAVAGLYQDTLGIVYKEIEQQKFYPALWSLLKDMHAQTRVRYESRLQRFGIETDPITEAIRLELAYLTTALQLLKPEPAQVKESFGVSQEFFTEQEAELYTFQVPSYLRDEVNQEIALITRKAATATSPIFLYQQSYTPYIIPAEYLSSEKLKNYFLTITWLQEKHFPLYSQADNCADCLLDEQDHLINFLASLYLTHDLSSTQSFKNKWANIYKSVAFFRGLESDLTYLDYQSTLVELYGEDYDLDTIFAGEEAAVKQEIKKIQERIARFNFLVLLNGRSNHAGGPNLRLLRDYHLPENVLFSQLTFERAGVFSLTGQVKPEEYPYTACTSEKIVYRCWPSGLDIFNLLNNPSAQTILDGTKSTAFDNYQANLNQLKEALAQFNENTWHDNAHLSMLEALSRLRSNEQAQYPVFMQNEGWARKSLNTSLAAWANSHRQIVLEKVVPETQTGFQSYFPYGYVEPQLEFYTSLLATVKMIKEGFIDLQILTEADKPYIRLSALETVLTDLITITQKELGNELLSVDDYNFINSFEKEITNVTGDIKQQNLLVSYQFKYTSAPKNILTARLNGLNYIIIAYPDPDGRLFFAIGPVFNYTESRDAGLYKALWQKDYNL